MPRGPVIGPGVGEGIGLKQVLPFGLDLFVKPHHHVSVDIHRRHPSAAGLVQQFAPGAGVARDILQLKGFTLLLQEFPGPVAGLIIGGHIKGDVVPGHDATSPGRMPNPARPSRGTGILVGPSKVGAALACRLIPELLRPVRFCERVTTMRLPRWVWGLALLLTFTLSALAAGSAAWRLFGVEPLRPAQAEAANPAAQPGQTEPPQEQPSRPAESFGRTVILIMGVDREGARSDTNLVAAMDPAKGEIGLISIPRDTYLEIPGFGWDKLAHANAYGGEELAMQTISRLLDLPIDHYAVVNFEGFKQVVDAVGGVEIQVTKPMHYDDPFDGPEGLHIHFEPGTYHMYGEEALKYARYRSDSDIQRMERQQELIKKVIEKGTNPANVLRVPALVKSLFALVQTDLSVAQGLDLALIGREMLRQGTLHATVLQNGVDKWLHASEETPDGVYYLVPDLVAYRSQAYQTLFGVEPPADYLERARAEQATLNEQVARQEEEDAVWRAAYRQRLAEAAAEAEAAGAVEPETPGEEGAAAQPGGDSALGGPGQKEGDGAAPAGNWTAAVVDASGRDLLQAYRRELAAQGFQVVQGQKAAQVLGSSLLVDRSGDPELAAQLQAQYPWARYQAVTDGEGPTIELYLGADAPRP